MYYFCLMIEGSGTGRPKNIRVRIRIQIPNAAFIFIMLLAILLGQKREMVFLTIILTSVNTKKLDFKMTYRTFQICAKY